jgi:hypothetical protein
MNDKEMINSPKLWPQWPALPLVSKTQKDGPFPMTGVILADNVTKVYRNVNIFEPHTTLSDPKEYATVEALLQDWRID